MVKEFSLQAAAPAEIVLNGQLQGLPLSLSGQVDDIDQFLAGGEVHFDGMLKVAGTTAAAKGRVFQPLTGKGMDIHVTGKTKSPADLFRAMGLSVNVKGNGDFVFDISDRDGPIALRNVTGRMTLAPGIRVEVEGRVDHPMALSGLALEVCVAADEVAEIAKSAGQKMPALGRLDMTGSLTGSAVAPALEKADGQIRHGAGAAIDFQGRVKDLLRAEGVNVHVAARTEHFEKMAPILFPSRLPSSRLVPGLRGRVEVAFDVQDRDDILALNNVKAELLPVQGVEITVSGQVRDAQALSGVALDMRL